MALPAVLLKAKGAITKAKTAKSVTDSAKSLKNNENSNSLFDLKKLAVLGVSVATGFVLVVILLVITLISYPLIVASGLFSSSDTTNNTSTPGTVGAYLQWAINIAEDDSHGYNQCARTGPDYDCSSLVWYSLKENGFDANLLGSYPFSTYTEANVLKSLGFTEYTYTSHADLQPGDILLRAEHTAIYGGNDLVIQASINEFGSICGGATGDQTGGEIHYDADYSSWNTYYRLEG